jgi:hypothetical protein
MRLLKPGGKFVCVDWFKADSIGRALEDGVVAEIEVGMLLPLLERGVAVHHSGMLPVLREVVEILFQENLVRLLFATETFAMGVNMPARTVVFTSIRKWDGETFRPPHAAEYIQMSGRAGRRGLDARGMVVLMLPEQMEREALRAMMGGAPLELTSSFRLRYNTLLRLYGMESLQPDVLVRRSFWAFQRAHAVPELHSRRHALLAEAAALTQPDDAQLEQLALLRETRRALEERVMEVALQPKHALRFLQPGRLVRVVERLDERLDARAATQGHGGEGGADGGGLGGGGGRRRYWDGWRSHRGRRDLIARGGRRRRRLFGAAGQGHEQRQGEHETLHGAPPSVGATGTRTTPPTVRTEESPSARTSTFSGAYSLG